MTSDNIYYTRQKIKNTQAYLGLSKMQQKVSTMRSNVKAIENSLEVVKNVGFDQWDKQTQSNYNNRLIVKEISDEA